MNRFGELIAHIEEQNLRSSERIKELNLRSSERIKKIKREARNLSLEIEALRIAQARRRHAHKPPRVRRAKVERIGTSVRVKWATGVRLAK